MANRTYSGLLNASGTSSEAFLAGSRRGSENPGPARRGIATAISRSTRSIAARAGTGRRRVPRRAASDARPARRATTPMCSRALAPCLRTRWPPARSRSRVSSSGAGGPAASSAAAAVTSWSIRLMRAPELRTVLPRPRVAERGHLEQRQHLGGAGDGERGQGRPGGRGPLAPRTTERPRGIFHRPQPLDERATEEHQRVARRQQELHAEVDARGRARRTTRATARTRSWPRCPAREGCPAAPWPWPPAAPMAVPRAPSTTIRPM